MRGAASGSLLILLALGCGSGAEAPADHAEVTLERLREGHTLSPIDAWILVGLRLVGVERDGPNPIGRRWIVGVDEMTGELVQGPALMARLPRSQPATLAERVLSVLIERHGTLPLRSDDERNPAISEEQWSLISAPIQTGTSLVFWAVVEQFEPTLIEYTVETDEWSVAWREAHEVLRAGEAGELRGPSFCEAVARCGCWDGCERVQPTQEPQLPDQAAFRALETPHRGQRLIRAECAEGECARVCVAAPGHTCLGALVPVEPERCEESCAVSVAPFHCETSANACRVVAHPSPP